MKQKKLRLWNGRGHGKNFNRGHFYVAAYTKKQAAQLIAEASESININSFYREINDYYSECWGDPMNGIIAEKPCVYGVENNRFGEKPKLILNK